MASVTSLTVSIPSTSTSTSNLKQQQQLLQPKSRWFSIEFFIYYLVFVCSLIKMVSTTLSLSQEQHRNYPFYKHKLSPGWIFDRKIDISDSQYRRFRLGLGQLTALAFGYLLIARLVGRHSRNRIKFQTCAAALILLALHGTSVFKILIIITANYHLARRAPSPLIWVFNVGVLFANDYWDGYRYRHFLPLLSFLVRKYRGLIPRWQIGFNISMLRLISYSFDYQWAAAAKAKQTTNSPRELSEYGFINYFNYVFYPPLYIAGPIITFNNFTSQIARSPSTITPRMIIGYSIRFLICFLTMEFVLHYMYVIAIKDARAWGGDSPFELSMIGYWNLIAVWLKLLIPWRFFRLWALLDGVDAPENMVRCMANNYSTLAFWRSWHRSYNLWIVRYIYLPLGGSNNVVPSTILVFTFVALWHDLSLRLLWWGWLVSVFVIPEVLAKKVFSGSIHEKKWYFRHLSAIGGTLNVLSMMSANLVGFAIGLDGVKVMWSQILGSCYLSGFLTLLTTVGALFCAVQMMMEYREEERREGIWRKC
ncbi:uncharacterized protein MELLADRAFT_32714 [Melampsora larici-populina 98AG31]|uniref:Glycerol transporter n=1 Tax=Melampsora larici-populina (strain 98AG31 / pathotype 3-4-7) TaxID=747676 RepID=F4R5D8_MELLP|nr:uncharacterized protein MELLADRAFT_32714 [Melampsora larici-populina 98AG31]EGG12029.1 hypothetical protein MELLADRAFT_32714 [Melampsora larici-populina 98AG31]